MASNSANQYNSNPPNSQTAGHSHNRPGHSAHGIGKYLLSRKSDPKKNCT